MKSLYIIRVSVRVFRTPPTRPDLFRETYHFNTIEDFLWAIRVLVPQFEPDEFGFCRRITSTSAPGYPYVKWSEKSARPRGCFHK